MEKVDILDVASGMFAMIVIVAFIAIVLAIWNVVMLVNKWSVLEDWAKVMYIILLFSGVGPLVSIILLYSGVGTKKKIN